MPNEWARSEGKSADLIRQTDLFAALQQPASLMVRSRFSENFALSFAVFLVIVFFMTTATALGTSTPPQYAWIVDFFPQTSLLGVMLGVTIFPRDKILYAVLAYTVAFLWAAFLTYPSVLSHVGPDGIGAFLALAYCVNLALGFVAAFLSRLLFNYAIEHRMALSPDILLAGSLLFFLLIFGGLCAYFVVHTAQIGVDNGPHSDHSAEIIAMIRVLKGAPIVVSSLLILFFPPSRKSLLRGLPFLLPFVALGLADRTFDTFETGLAFAALSLSLRAFLPIRTAIVMGLAAIVVHAIAAGPSGVETLTDYTMKSAAFLLILLCDIWVLDHSEKVHFRERNLQFLLQSQEFSKIGYYVVDPTKAEMYLSPSAQDLLSSPPRVVFDDRFNMLMHPDDRDKVGQTLADPENVPRIQIVRFATDPSQPENYHYIRIYNRYLKAYGGKGFLVGTLLDVTEVFDTEETLRKTILDLENAQEQQSRLMSVIAHEMRTPALISGMVIEEMDKSGDWATNGPRLRGLSDQIVRVIDDIRQVLQPAEHMPLEMSRFSPDKLTQSVISDYALLADDRKIQFVAKVDVDPDVIRVSDATRIRQIIGNLLKNAILHSGCTKIEISYFEQPCHDDNTLCGTWRIRDNGSGLPKDLLPVLFEPFSRAITGARSSSKGSGLGLYITKTTAELLGGEIQYVPQDRQGTLFEVRVPVFVRKPVKDAKDDTAKKSTAHLPMSVLLVEDQKLIGEITQVRLARLFDHVEWAHSAEEALDIARRTNPDLILTDHNLPKMSGTALVGRLRHEGYKGLIFGCSAALDQATTDRFEDAGADGMIAKPVDMKSLQDRITSLQNTRASDMAEQPS